MDETWLVGPKYQVGELAIHQGWKTDRTRMPVQEMKPKLLQLVPVFLNLGRKVRSLMANCGGDVLARKSVQCLNGGHQVGDNPTHQDQRFGRCGHIVDFRSPSPSRARGAFHDVAQWDSFEPDHSMERG